MKKEYHVTVEISASFEISVNAKNKEEAEKEALKILKNRNQQIFPIYDIIEVFVD